MYYVASEIFYMEACFHHRITNKKGNCEVFFFIRILTFFLIKILSLHLTKKGQNCEMQTCKFKKKKW